jgi:hypothetical protein
MRRCAAVVLMWAQQSRLRTVIEDGLRSCRAAEPGQTRLIGQQLLRHACNKLGHALQAPVVLCKVTLWSHLHDASASHNVLQVKHGPD